MFSRTHSAGRRVFKHMYGARKIWVSVLVGALALLLSAEAALAETRVFLDSSGRKFTIDTENPPAWLRLTAPPTKQLKATTITFNVTYMDIVSNTDVGFDHPSLGAARQATVDLALEYIDSVLNATGSCDIVFEESETGGDGYLAAGGTFFPLMAGFTNGDAFDHITTGVDPSGGSPDIFVTVDFGWNWNTGTSTPSFGQFDLLSVLIHEITHGLGIISLSASDGSSEIGGATDVFSFWDSFLETGNGQDLWNDSTAAFMGTSPDLTGNDGGVVSVGADATTEYGSNPPIYAPAIFNSGSSLGHFDSSIIGGAVMEPSTAAVETHREYALVEIGALRDIGYTSAAEPSTLPEVDFSSSLYSATEGDGTVMITVQLSAAPGTGNTAEVNYATSNWTARAGSDYTAASGTLTFGSTQTERTFIINIADDGAPEINETVTLTLSNPVDATLAGTNNPAILRIFDDDPGLNSFIIPFFR